MINITDPVTRWAFAVLVSVLAGTFFLIVVAIFRRWTQIQFAHHVHNLRKEYRPVVANVLSGKRIPAEVERLRQLPLADLELLLDPVFSKRKVPERCLGALEGLCGQLGLIKLWQSRAESGLTVAAFAQGIESEQAAADPPMLRHLLRAKSIRNLGILRHRPSWRLLISALDDRHVDIQLVALRSLAAIGAPESFPPLSERLQAVIQGLTSSPPLQGLQAAMASFDLSSAPALRQSLLHPNRAVRFCAAEILRTIVYRHAAQDPDFSLTAQSISASLVELLLTKLPEDSNSDVRARAAEVIIFLPDPRRPSLLRRLLADSQWYVRMRTVRAIARMGQAAGPLHSQIRECIADPHWRVREAAIHTLLSFGADGARQVFDEFMKSADEAVREQILEIAERVEMANALADAYDTPARADSIEQLNDGEAVELPPSRAKSGPALQAEFLHRVSPELSLGKSDSHSPGRKSKGARRGPFENDGPRYPSV